MRLTCPNCGARYEVDDSMVPPEGRDVQCSNCSTTWFQPGPGAEAERPRVYVERRMHVPAAGSEDDAEIAPPPDGQARPPRREIDPAVRDILRQEAEREAQLRSGAVVPVETQSEMSLEEQQTARIQSRRQAELDEAQDAFADPHEDLQSTVGARRDLLPDIEEINSTLRATADRSPDEQTASDIDTLAAAPRRRRGRRFGFVLVILIAALGAGAYSQADLIAAQLPEAEPYLAQFVTLVNEARFWLDDQARMLADLASEALAPSDTADPAEGSAQN